MLDIIIPSYNDLIGLYHSLNSFGPYVDLDKVHLYIIDDASTTITKEDYNILVQHYSYLNPTILYLSTNKGPGYARQYGIDNSQADYLFFLDCGNLLASPLIIQNLLDAIIEAPKIDFFAMNYLMETREHTFVNCNRNSEFHGALLKRTFLQKYNLRIPTTYSYSLEDTSFFIFVHFIAKFINTYQFLDIIPIIRTFNIDSLTNKDHQDFYFKYMIPGYLYNTLELYNNVLIPDGLNKRIFLLNLIVTNYYLLQSTRNYSMQYFEEYLPDVHLFFDKYIQQLSNEDYDQIFRYVIQRAQEYLEECLTLQIVPTIDIQPFLEWCQMPLEISNIPERWLKYGS